MAILRKTIIWRRKEFIKFLSPYEDPWQFEIYGTERAKSYDRRFLILSDKQKPIFAYNIDISTGYGLYGGKWLINNIELFKNNKYMKKRKR